jgi:glycosyltransferase 2 family protein
MKIKASIRGWSINMIKAVLKYVISLGIALGLLYWTLKDYNFSDNFEKLKSANFNWVYLSAIFTIIAHTSRAIRSKMLLEPLGYKPSTLNATLAVFLGYFANYLVPRLGEVTRCTTLTNTEGIPFEKSFGTVITERIVDFAMLFLLLILNFILEFDRLSTFFIGFFKEKLNFKFNAANLIFLVVALLIIILGLRYIWLKNKVNILKNTLINKVLTFAKGLLEGITSIKNLKNPFGFIMHSLLIWLMYYLMTYCMFFAFDETKHLSLLAGLSTLIVGAIGIAAPTPGGLGTYHALVGALMVLYGLTTEAGKSLAIFLHGSQMVITILFGIISFIVLFFMKKKPINN